MADTAVVPGGILKHQIAINLQSTTLDDYGQPVISWAALLITRAAIHAVTNRELYSLGGFMSQVTHSIIIRYPAVSVTAGMQVVYEGRTFLIQAVSDPDENKRQLNIYSQEISS